MQTQKVNLKHYPVFWGENIWVGKGHQDILDAKLEGEKHSQKFPDQQFDILSIPENMRLLLSFNLNKDPEWIEDVGCNTNTQLSVKATISKSPNLGEPTANVHQGGYVPDPVAENVHSILVKENGTLFCRLEESDIIMTYQKGLYENISGYLSSITHVLWASQ